MSVSDSNSYPLVICRGERFRFINTLFIISYQASCNCSHLILTLIEFDWINHAVNCCRRLKQDNEFRCNCSREGLFYELYRLNNLSGFVGLGRPIGNPKYLPSAKVVIRAVAATSRHLSPVATPTFVIYGPEWTLWPSLRSQEDPEVIAGLDKPRLKKPPVRETFYQRQPVQAQSCLEAGMSFLEYTNWPLHSVQKYSQTQLGN